MHSHRSGVPEAVADARGKAGGGKQQVAMNDILDRGGLHVPLHLFFQLPYPELLLLGIGV